MKNLKAQFKLIIYLFLLLNIHNTLLTRNLDKFSDSGDIANYFSGILSKNNYQYKKSYYYLKSLNNLEDFHYTYSQHYQHSLVALGKFKEAASYTKKLNDKKLDNFESNLISIIYHLENEDFKNASSYLQKLKNNSQPDTVQDLVSRSLNIWLNFKNIEDLDSALKLLNIIPKQFNNIKNIQKTFIYCYFDSPKADIMFKQLIFSSNVDYTRYNFFYSNYLISKNNEKKAQEVLDSSLKQNPNNLILNQLKIDLIKKKTFNNKFECKNTTDVMAEIFYVIANALSSQNNYIASNFYLNLARYLNPNFVSYDSLYAENFFLINEYEKAKKIYNQIKQKGSTYNWYASKQIASILSEQNQKKIQ